MTPTTRRLVAALVGLNIGSAAGLFWVWPRPAPAAEPVPPARLVPLDLTHALHRSGADVWGFDVPAGCALEVVETRPDRRPERVAGHALLGQGADRVFVLIDAPARRGNDPAGPVRVTVAGTSGHQTVTRPHPVPDYSERTWNRDQNSAPEVDHTPSELVAFAPTGGPVEDAGRVGYAVRIVSVP